MPKPGEAGRSRGRAVMLTKIVLSLAVIAVIGAAAALTGASATPSSGPEGPTVKHLPPVAPAVFDGSVRNLPQLDRPGKRDIPKPRPWQNEELEPALLAKTTLPGAQDVPAAADLADAAAPGPGSGAFAGTFPGLDSANWGAGWPPDTNGDVGPTYFIQAVNTSIGIFRKTDGARVAAFTFDTLFSGTGTLCDNDNGGDPTVTYDPVHDRWFVADFAFSGDGSAPPYYECIAVSKSGDPVAGGWYFYAVRADDSAHPWFPDYPKMGIWPDGLYMTANMFGNSFQEVRGWAFNLDDLTSGAPLRSAV